MAFQYIRWQEFPARCKKISCEDILLKISCRTFSSSGIWSNSLETSVGIESVKARVKQTWFQMSSFKVESQLLNYLKTLFPCFKVHYQSFCDGSRNFSSVNSKFWRICKKCFRELTIVFPQSFLTNPSKLRKFTHAKFLLWSQKLW
jgi:hypothetical protein